MYREVNGKIIHMIINSATSHADVWGSGVIAPPFFTSALSGGE
jgi:hypothetical protein